MEERYRIGEAAAILGVRVETLRRWERQGRLRAVRSVGGQRLIPISEVTRLLAERRPQQAPVAARSTRNHFPGVVTAVKRDRLVATVEILSGPHRVVALTTREAVDELGLRPGMEVIAAVKATNVIVEVPQ
ncbi:MAG: TOBE domain-containing protein [Acidimicrobiia bacterium]